MVRAHAGPLQKLHYWSFSYFCNMQKIKTLVFDLGGVIINLKPELDWFQNDMMKHFDNDQLINLYKQFYFREFEKGIINPTDFILQLKDIALNKNCSDEEIKKYWCGILLDIPVHRIDILKKLKEKYRLILLSNTNQIHVDCIRAYMQQTFGEDVLEGNFHHCYYSQEIGMRKPDAEIYEFVMEQQKLIPTETLFLDDKEENLIEPQKLGWQTFHVNFNKLSINDLQFLL